MKTIFVTQREDLISGELRDNLDIRWIQFLYNCNIQPIVIPNNENILKIYLEKFQSDGVLLTGGGLIASLGGNDKRDKIEKILIRYCIKNNKPLLGVCRGMQQIQAYFGIKLKKINNHVNNKFRINFENIDRIINSYHDYGTDVTNEDLIVTSRSNDNIIKSVTHVKYNINGIMWHPERNLSFDKIDINLFRKIYV